MTGPTEPPDMQPDSVWSYEESAEPEEHGDPHVNGATEPATRARKPMHIDPAGTTATTSTATKPRVAWQDGEAGKRLQWNKSGGLVNSVANAVTILANEPEWQGVIARDEFAEKDIARTMPPWGPDDAPGASVGQWRDVDTTRLRNWLQRKHGIALGVGDVEQAVSLIAARNAFHPVREYLNALVWDGKQRLPRMLSLYFGTEQSSYTEAIGLRWMISAVARVMRPGCQVDCTLILEGVQGVGKSSGFRALVPESAFYSETTIAMGDKDSYQALHGVWIYLLDEIDSIRRGENTKVKNFLTSPKDHYRESYGRRTRDFLRQNVFCGTTDGREYFTDTAGNRRYLPARVLRPIDPTAIARDRDQLWAEARTRFEGGEPWHIDTPEVRVLCEEEQARRLPQDSWVQKVEEWISNPEREEQDVTEYGRPVRRRVPFKLDPRGVSIGEVLEHAIGMKPDRINRAAETRCGDVLRTMGFGEPTSVRESGGRVRRYALPQTSPVQPGPT